MSEQSKSTPDLEQLAAAALRKTEREIAKHRRLVANLKSDVEKHGDPEQWKRYGDLLLANAGNATRRDGRIVVVDYFDKAAPEIEIDENKTISDVAESYFRQYTKARNGAKVIAQRMAAADAAIAKGEAMRER